MGKILKMFLKTIFALSIAFAFSLTSAMAENKSGKFSMTSDEKLHAAYLKVISKKCDISIIKRGESFGLIFANVLVVKTKKVGVKKKQLPSGNVDHISVYETTGFDKVYDAFGPIATPLRKKSCKALYEDARARDLAALLSGCFI